MASTCVTVLCATFLILCIGGRLGGFQAVEAAAPGRCHSQSHDDPTCAAATVAADDETDEEDLALFQFRAQLGGGVKTQAAASHHAAAHHKQVASHHDTAHHEQESRKEEDAVGNKKALADATGTKEAASRALGTQPEDQKLAASAPELLAASSAHAATTGTSADPVQTTANMQGMGPCESNPNCHACVHVMPGSDVACEAFSQDECNEKSAQTTLQSEFFVYCGAVAATSAKSGAAMTPATSLRLPGLVLSLSAAAAVLRLGGAVA